MLDRNKQPLTKAALQDLEWVTNFGLDADSLKDHPGESAALAAQFCDMGVLRGH